MTPYFSVIPNISQYTFPPNLEGIHFYFIFHLLGSGSVGPSFVSVSLGCVEVQHWVKLVRVLEELHAWPTEDEKGHL